jgi:hypothetical protein
MRYEILDENGNVTNIIEATEQHISAFPAGRFRLVPDAVISPIVVPEPVLILKTAFVNRFTLEEWTAVSSSADEDILAFFNRIDPLRIVNLTAVNLRQELEMLVDKGILTEERQLVILDTNLVQETERP